MISRAKLARVSATSSQRSTNVLRRLSPRLRSVPVQQTACKKCHGKGGKQMILLCQCRHLLRLKARHFGCCLCNLLPMRPLLLMPLMEIRHDTYSKSRALLSASCMSINLIRQKGLDVSAVAKDCGKALHLLHGKLCHGKLCHVHVMVLWEKADGRIDFGAQFPGIKSNSIPRTLESHQDLSRGPGLCPVFSWKNLSASTTARL